jgi:lipid-binding SYLF domain-containing protein
MSFLKRLSTDAANAYQDLYSNWILGDDAGKSALFTLVLRQQQKQQQSSNEQTVVSSLGMTFVEVNGRAYVYSVTEGSIADEAGIMPQDAVQYATVVRPEWVSISASSAITHDGQTSTVTSNYHDQINNNMTPIDRTTTNDENSLAVKYVLNLERKGARIGYDQLRTLLCKKAMLNETTITTAFLSPPCDCNNNSRQGSMYLCSNNNRYSGNEHSSPSKWNGPPIPSNVCVPIAAENFGNYDEDDITINEKSILYDENGHAYPQQTQQLPVVFVFRRTRQRKSFLQMGVLPSFRLDDECDLASSLVRRLAPSANMDVPPPDTWEELVHDGTDWLLGNGSILPPNLFKAGSGSGGGISSGAIQIESNPDKKKSSMMTRNGSSSSNPNGIPSKYKPSKYDDDDYTSPPDALNVSTTSSVDEDDNDNKNTNYYHCNHTATTCQHDFEEEELSRIPLDEFEKDRAIRVANLQSRMTVEAQRVDRSDDVEAATLRGMIQKAVGLAFVRASKVVLGVSVHGGSGIVIARLPDGTWSAPLAIGTWGIGFGIQFGLEVAEYIFILQTQEALDHFRRGGSYTVGGNMGVAFAGLGREAYGAASVGGVCGGTNTYDVNDTDIYDQYSDNDSRVARQQRQNQSNDGTTSSLNGAIAPIVAYAKSQGLYVGVSLEGSRIFARDDINSRVYKFSTWGRDVTANDILSGKVPTPSEAEGLYAALHCVEFAHEMSCLPRPPDVLLRDYNNPWQFDRSPLGGGPSTGSSINGYPKQKESFAFLSNITAEEKEQCEVFETKFKNFLYGGVSVQRLLVDENDNESLFDKKSPLSQQRNERARRRTRKERRTLWLMLPEVGSLRLGFVSKLSDGENPLSITKNINRKTQQSVSPSTGANHRDTNDRLRFVNDAHNTFSDIATTNSEELTLDSAIQTKVRDVDHNVNDNYVSSL